MDPEAKEAGLNSADNSLCEKLGQTEPVKLGDVQAVRDELVEAQGHARVLRKNFSTLASLGLGFGITNSWIGYAAAFGANVVYGGPQNVIFALLVATFVQYFITLGLSEIASSFPSSGGQYHAVWLLATPKSRRFLAFVVGFWSIIGWWVVTCSGISVAAVAVSGLVQFWFPDFVATNWNLYLIYLAVIAGTAVPIYLAHKTEPYFTRFGLGCSVFGAATTFIVLLSMKKQTQPGSFVTASNTGTSGWGQNFAWVLGIGNSMYSYVATDAALHIAEEMLRPSSQLPFILNTTILIGFLTTFPVFMVMMFTLKDLDAVLASPLPSLECFYQTTGSKAAATGLQVIVTVCLCCAVFGEWITCSRLVWAFARDNGFPFSKYFAHVDKKKKVPVRSLVISVVFCALYGVLYFASSTAFNSVVTSAIIGLNMTYTVPQGILLFRGRHLLLARALNLGPLGWFCNAFSVFVVTALTILLCFPPVLPTSVGSMNYSSVVLFGLMAVVIFLWMVKGRRTFHGPEVDVDMIESLAAQAFTAKRKFLGVTWRYTKEK